MDKPLHNFHVDTMTLWYDATEFSPIYTANHGFDTAFAYLKLGAAHHVEDIQLIDSSALSQKELMDIYLYHAVTCPWWLYKVRPVFGSNRNPGWLAGKQVPLLSIRFDTEVPPMVAPYQDWQVEGEPFVSILQVLKMLSPAEQKRLFGQTVQD